MILVTHLWQSTVCLGIAAILALILRRASARTRYTIWLFASVKFLVPLSLFVVAGSFVGTWMSALTSPQVSGAFRWLDRSIAYWHLDALAGSDRSGFAAGVEPMLLGSLLVVWAGGTAWLAISRLRQWRAVSRIACAARRLESGREAETLDRLSRRSARRRRIELFETESNFEPGVFGVIRPKLLWPAELSRQLTDDELEGVIAHEICHVDRGDNLNALIQTLVETVFWFYPPVWWLGARLVAERERACDEGVVHMGADKRRYAQSILKVCGFCLRSPVVFVPGISGSSLSRRVEWILSHPVPTRLALPARLLLASIVVVTVAVPLAAGVLGGHRESAADQDQPKVYRPGNGVSWPKLVHEVKPKSTKDAMRARIEGSSGSKRSSSRPATWEMCRSFNLSTRSSVWMTRPSRRSSSGASSRGKRMTRQCPSSSRSRCRSG